MRTIKAILICIICFNGKLSANTNSIIQREIKNEQDRIQELKNQQTQQNIILQNDNKIYKYELEKNEIPCFHIDKIILINNEENKEFQNLIDSTLKELKFKKGICLGQNSINVILNSLNNKIISKGYITSSFSIEPTNLKNKIIKLKLNMGRIDDISINNEHTKRNKASLFTALGEINHKKILNLRNIEQALENISKSSNKKSTISLIPSQLENQTNIIINKDEEFPLSFSIKTDNAGSKPTGKYQTSTSLISLNLFGFNESFVFSYTKNFIKSDKVKLKTPNDKEEIKRGNSSSHYINFSIPFGYFDFSIFTNKYNYTQAVPGAYQIYKYSGSSKYTNSKISYLYYRDKTSKNYIYFDVWRRASKNFIEDYELKNQRRRTAGYDIGLNSEIFLNTDTLKFDLSFQRGTGMFSSLQAPENNFNEGTNRMKIITFVADYSKNLTQNLLYDINTVFKWNKSPLSIQDQLSIGGKTTVRGFDGEMSLVGQRGYYVQNTLNYNYLNKHKIYFALDGGRVSGAFNDFKGSQTLIGGGIGLSGAIKAIGTINYDLLFSRPLKKPEFFNTNKVCVNFSLGYYF